MGPVVNRLLGLLLLAYFIGAPSYLFMVVILAALRWATYNMIPWLVVFALPVVAVLAVWLLMLSFWFAGKLFEKAGKRHV